MKVYIIFTLSVAALWAESSADTQYAHCHMEPSSVVSDRGNNNVRGSVDIKQEDGAMIEFKLNLTGFDQMDSVMKHGFHIHEFGDMSGGCPSMGGHYNPLNVNHGAPNNGPFERHVGDLGNIEEMGGSVIATFYDYEAMLSGDYTIIGRGLVVHADEDDLGMGGNEDSLSTGNAGSRIACCVIGIADGTRW